MVEMSWNVNQPGRWRRPQLTSVIKEAWILTGKRFSDEIAEPAGMGSKKIS